MASYFVVPFYVRLNLILIAEYEVALKVSLINPAKLVVSVVCVCVCPLYLVIAMSSSIDLYCEFGINCNSVKLQEEAYNCLLQFNNTLVL